jgi:hypothetical protein
MITSRKYWKGINVVGGIGISAVLNVYPSKLEIYLCIFLEVFFGISSKKCLYSYVKCGH